eukprot:5748556-Prymnesium_polylepis.1
MLTRCWATSSRHPRRPPLSFPDPVSPESGTELQRSALGVWDATDFRAGAWIVLAEYYSCT